MNMLMSHYVYESLILNIKLNQKTERVLLWFHQLISNLENNKNENNNNDKEKPLNEKVNFWLV